jgi:hypothetical protein
MRLEFENMTIQLNLSDELKTLAESRAKEAGHHSLDSYLASLIRADVEQDVSAELEGALLAGLDSGPALDVTAQFWADLKQRARRSAKS